MQPSPRSPYQSDWLAKLVEGSRLARARTDKGLEGDNDCLGWE